MSDDTLDEMPNPETPAEAEPAPELEVPNLETSAEGDPVGEPAEPETPPLTDEELAALQAEEEAKLAEEAARKAEEDRLATAERQAPNVVKIMRQIWHGNRDDALRAVLANVEPEAYEVARLEFEAEIAEYNRTNLTQDKTVPYKGEMPSAKQPTSRKKGRR